MKMIWMASVHLFVDTLALSNLRDFNLSSIPSLFWIFISLLSWFLRSIYILLPRLPIPHPEFSFNPIFFCPVMLFFTCPFMDELAKELSTVIPRVLLILLSLHSGFLPHRYTKSTLGRGTLYPSSFGPLDAPQASTCRVSSSTGHCILSPLLWALSSLAFHYLTSPSICFHLPGQHFPISVGMLGLPSKFWWYSEGPALHPPGLTFCTLLLCYLIPLMTVLPLSSIFLFSWYTFAVYNDYIHHGESPRIHDISEFFYNSLSSSPSPSLPLLHPF